jgi:hypothetical protein
MGIALLAAITQLPQELSHEPQREPGRIAAMVACSGTGGRAPDYYINGWWTRLEGRVRHLRKLNLAYVYSILSFPFVKGLVILTTAADLIKVRALFECTVEEHREFHRLPKKDICSFPQCFASTSRPRLFWHEVDRKH